MDFEAFRRGDDDSRQHEPSWVAQVDDRLDAEYYQPRGRRDVVALEDVWGGFRQRAEHATGQITRSDITGSFKELETVTTRIGDLLEERQEPCLLEADESYRLCGVRWWGKGTFLREEKLGKEIKSRYLRRLRSGWLIYNRLFARKGSFAIVDAEAWWLFRLERVPHLRDQAACRQPYCSETIRDALDEQSTVSTTAGRSINGVYATEPEAVWRK